ncbi:uncharacterized protein C1683.06c-like [Thrips palmi]|uniref:Uncharacterized protein C1683.06c-like n=1 Tax=Thrips palmi TaxID=161013 RepID=A0A6P8XY37_THRPL|nr:uncharacterized protein C1683.06c-like [Thrips palmi]
MSTVRCRARWLTAAVVAVWAVCLTTLAVLASVLVEAPDVRVLVIDTDAGADDAVAILELLRAEEMHIGRDWTGRRRETRVLAITCVFGNTGVENVTKNVLATLETAGRQDVPVYTGAGVALLPPKPTYDFYFGEDGFGDFLPPGPPDVNKVQPEHAAAALVRLAREHKGQLSLLCIGPLTNIALAVRLDAAFLDNLRDLFILGGAAHGNGNYKPGAEFNMYSDPDAAMIVLDAVPTDKPAFLLSWETALDAELPVAWRRDVLGAAGTADVAFLNRAEGVLLATLPTWNSADGLLAAHILDARVCPPGKAVRVDVLSGQGPGRGVSLVDHSNTTRLPANAVLVEKPDVAAFQRLLLRLLGSKGS